MGRERFPLQRAKRFPTLGAVRKRVVYQNFCGGFRTRVPERSPTTTHSAMLLERFRSGGRTCTRKVLDTS